ncbi:MAG: peptidoglycan-binding protein [Ilumatobacteraceae bacterium]
MPALVVHAPSAAAARPKVLLIGDSTLAAVDWYPASKAGLDGLDYVLEAESCRAVTATSCVGRRDSAGRRIRPSNTLTVMKSYAAGTFDELVLMVGYDESYDTFKKSVGIIEQTARDLGIDHVTWLTFRVGGSYTAPTKVSYFGNNSILVDAAKSSGGYISLLDWNYWTRQHSGLLESDGVHLTAKGALSVAQLIRQGVINHWGSGAVDRSSSSGGSGQGALRVGSVGPEVVRLQQALLQVGASPSLVPYGATGRFYAVTRQAMIEFQTMVRGRYDSSVVVDGIVGAQTRAWLDQLTSATGASSTSTSSSSGTSATARPTLRYGSTGSSVRDLQQLLLQVGASPSLVPYGATGRFFAATEAAVREFQAWVRANHSGSVVVDGIAGGQTWSWLARLSAAGTTATRASGSSSGSANTASTAAGDRPELSYGMFGPPVTEMQRMLLRIGSTELAPYGATGKYYRVTRAAVRDFQEMVQARYDASVAVDGVVGPQTWAWLIQLDPG